MDRLTTDLLMMQSHARQIEALAGMVSEALAAADHQSRDEADQVIELARTLTTRIDTLRARYTAERGLSLPTLFA